MQIIIDSNAGVCPGVHRAIVLAEKALSDRSLICIGDIIHNPQEIDRLEKLGLHHLRPEKALTGDNAIKEKHAFIRSHGIERNVARRLEQKAASITDATCPKVSRIHELVRQYAEKGYQILIVGKAGHAEVLGILSHSRQQGIVITLADDIDLIDKHQKSLLVAQTTVGRARFERIAKLVVDQVDNVTIIDTLCDELDKRYLNIKTFANSVDVLLFVGGRNSSNSNELFKICKQENSASYFIEKPDEIDPEWLKERNRVGITGGASTPRWQLEAVKTRLGKSVQKGRIK